MTPERLREIEEFVGHVRVRLETEAGYTARESEWRVLAGGLAGYVRELAAEVERLAKIKGGAIRVIDCFALLMNDEPGHA